MRLLLSLRAPTLSSFVTFLSFADDRVIILRSVNSAGNSPSEVVTDVGDSWAVAGSISEPINSIGLETPGITWHSPSCTCRLVPFCARLCYAMCIISKTFSGKKRHSKQRYSWKAQQSMHRKSHTGGDGGGAEELESWTST